MPAPYAWTPAAVARVESMRAAGAPTSAILEALRRDGHPCNWRTLKKRLAAMAPRPSGETTAELVARFAPPPATPAAPPVGTPEDDLARLARRRDQVERAIEDYERRLAIDPSAVRAHAVLTKRLTELTSALVALRPQPEAEADRLVALGAEARDELLRRASADEPATLRAELARLEGLVAKLMAIEEGA